MPFGVWFSDLFCSLDFFNPFLSMIKAGFGSLAYQGVWSIFDIIMVNRNLANPEKGTFGINPIVNKKFYFLKRLFLLG